MSGSGGADAPPGIKLSFVFWQPRDSSSLVRAKVLPDELGANVMAYLGDVALKYELVADYLQRPKINDEFARRLDIS